MEPDERLPFLADGSLNPAYFAYTGGGNLNVVWNESWLPAATGGGPSAIYTRPSWQEGVASVIGSNARGVPDLAWDAAVNGDVLVYITAFPTYQRPGWHVYGGTSAASSGLGAAVTRDPVTGWPVRTGYDMTTGLGTPNAPAYVSGLAGS